MKKYYMLLYVFLFININIQAQGSGRQGNTNVMNEILAENYGHDYFDKTLYDERVSRYDRSTIIFFNALKFEEINNLRAAISELERAIQQCPQGVYYYHYGVFLMDMRDYRNAERAFVKALQFFDYWDPYYEAFHGGENPLYTFDQNGASREKYYTYYNLACVNSMMNNPDTSFKYIKEALEYGYPDIDHIYTDSNLRNMFNKSGNLISQIRAIYNAGLVNSISGKSFEYEKENEWIEYVFVDNKNIFVRSTKDFDNVRYGTYEIKNYQIIIQYNDGQEVLNIKDMSKTWKESRYNPNR